MLTFTIIGVLALGIGALLLRWIANPPLRPGDRVRVYRPDGHGAVWAEAASVHPRSGTVHLRIGATHYLYHRDEIARLNGEWTAFLTPEGTTE